MKRVRNFFPIFILVLVACRAPAVDALPTSEDQAAEAIASATLPETTETPALSAEQLITLGSDVLNSGDATGAIVLLDQAIALNSEIAQAYLLRGNAYKQLGDQAQALTNYDQAIILDVNLSAAFHNRALLHAEMGNNQQALADFARAIELAPTFGLAYRNRAAVHVTLGNSAAAALDLQIYLTFVPNAPDKAQVEAQIAELQAQTVQTAGEGGLLFFDDFSDPASGWYTNGDPASPGGYSGGGYVLVKSQPAGAVWAMPGRLFSDVRIEVKASKQGGDNDNFFGIMCRIQGTSDRANFYALIISSDGYYGIAKRVDEGEMALIQQDKMLFSSDIIQGESTNTITAVCAGQRLALYVNGELLVEATDPDLASGQVGLMVGAFAIEGTSIFFDDFSVFSEAVQ